MRSPTPAVERYDLAVIGAGSGGLSVAAGAAQLGLKVVLFERGEMGGDCLNTGCVPSKALIAAAGHAHGLGAASRFGLKPVKRGVHWPDVRRSLEDVIAAIAPIDSQERFEGLGCRVIREHARFLDGKTLQSPSTRVRARRIVIAAGGGPLIPAIPGLRDVPFLTNETIFKINELPAHLLVLGGGAIGLELAQAFARLGSQVTVVEAERCLSREDPDAAALVVERLQAEGVSLRQGAKVLGVSQHVEHLELTLELAGGRRDTLAGTHVLVAAGRGVNTEGLDLEQGGVAFDAKGVTTDAFLRSTSNKRVWAVGDIAGRERFTHAAGWHAGVFVRNALFKAKTRADSTPIPRVTFTAPELAQVGLTEAEAKAAFGAKRVSVARWAFHDNDRAQAERATDGFGKLMVGKGGKILGATLVGEGAGEAIQLVTLAMANGLTVRALTNYVAPYPTRGEIVKRLAGAYYTPLLFSARSRFLVGLLQRV